MSSEPATRAPPAELEPMRLRSSLFVRIYVTFVVSVLGFALLAVGLVWRAGQVRNDEWVTSVADRVDQDRDALLAGLRLREQGEQAMRVVVDEIERDLDATVVVHPRIRGRRLGPPHPRPAEETESADHGRESNFPSRPIRVENFAPPPPLTRDEYKQLRRGQPIVRRHRFAPPEIGLPLFSDVPLEPPPGPRGPSEPDDEDAEANPRGQQVVGVVRVTPRDNPLRGLAVAGLLLLLVLAGGAWPLARSLTHRLARLEKSTRSLARGEYSHRAQVGDGPRDEIDRLARAFNDMAERLQAVLTGQQTLLANVSHELRTPIARLRVLVELLGERLARMDQDGEITDARGLVRMKVGFAEMEQDLAEVDTLINDLLTSGRLELGRGNALQVADVAIRELCERAASRFAATVECPAEPLQVQGDALLLERLLRNLLTNARRACPDGAVVVRALMDEGHVVIEVEDEGPGVAPDKRSLIFEPFARLDAARARDQGGVGLGLHLCRQIAAAHGGTLRAEGRRDEQPGARFVLRL